MYKSIRAFFLIQILGWGGSLYLRTLGIDYVRHHILFSIYFLLVTLAIVVIYRHTFVQILHRPTMEQIVLFFSMYLITAIFYILYGSNPNLPNLLSYHPEAYFLILNSKYLMAKSCEILFQQTSIVLLILLLHNKKFSTWKITKIFLAVFPAIHLFNYIHLPFFFANILFIGSLLASLIFPYLIINSKKDGYIYTYIIHWSFYLIVDILLVIRFLYF